MMERRRNGRVQGFGVMFYGAFGLGWWRQSAGPNIGRAVRSWQTNGGKRITGMAPNNGWAVGSGRRLVVEATGGEELTMKRPGRIAVGPVVVSGLIGGGAWALSAGRLFSFHATLMREQLIERFDNFCSISV